MNHVALYVLLCWFVICVGIAVIAFFQKDYKFGTQNFLIAGLVFGFFFLCPILLPIMWLFGYARGESNIQCK